MRPPPACWFRLLRKLPCKPVCRQKKYGVTWQRGRMTSNQPEGYGFKPCLRLVSEVNFSVCNESHWVPIFIGTTVVVEALSKFLPSSPACDDCCVGGLHAVRIPHYAPGAGRDPASFLDCQLTLTIKNTQILSYVTPRLSDAAANITHDYVEAADEISAKE